MGIVDYEIGSGYGPLNDAERRNAVATTAAFVTGGRLHAMDKRFAYTLKITGLTRARDCRSFFLPLLLSFAFSASFSLLPFSRLPEGLRSINGAALRAVRSLNHCW